MFTFEKLAQDVPLSPKEVGEGLDSALKVQKLIGKPNSSGKPKFSIFSKSKLPEDSETETLREVWRQRVQTNIDVFNYKQSIIDNTIRASKAVGFKAPDPYNKR
jgi:hypothetical protein